MAASLPKGFLGSLAIKKTAGQTTPAVGTQTAFPTAAVNPRNPFNFSYMAVINVLGFASLKTQGKKTPTIEIARIPVKQSWFAGSAGLNLISDLIGVSATFLDANNNVSEYAVQTNDSVNSRVYDGGKCTKLCLYQEAVGGPILMDLSFVCIYGDSEKGSPTSFSAVSSDPGTTRDVTATTFTTATDVQSWRLCLMRPEAYQPTHDGTYYMASVESGMFGGTLTVVQGANAGTVASTSETITIASGGGVGTNLQIALSLNKDEKVEDAGPTLLTQRNDYSLFSGTSTYPVVLTNV